MRTKKFVPVLFILATIILLAACTDSPPQSQLTPTATVTPDVLVVAPVDGDSEPVAVVPENTAAPPEGESQIVTTPTPEPTATPGIIEDAVSDIATATGLDRQIILGLTGEDWVNILISLGIALVGIFVVTQLVYILLLWIAKRAPGERASIFLRAVQFQIRSFIGIFILQYATNRLIFLSAEFKQTLNQIYFSLYVIAATAILCRLIGFALRWYQARISGEPEEPKLNEFLGLIDRLLRAFLLIISTTVILNNFGVNVTVMLAVLGIGGLALSLAAQDTLSDIINGFLILIDQPFRIGDRILIHELETWGDIVGIGTRTTRIQTLDNRLVIVPNAAIGKSQVVNYSYPDPSYRVQTEIGIAYGSDIDQATQIIVDTLSGMEGVMLEKPVEVLLLEFGESALKFRLRWWLESYTDTRNVYDRVHRDLYKALDQAGIEMPFSTYDVNMKVDPEDVKMISSSLKANQE